MATLPRTRRERRVFVDSGAYLGLMDRRDDHHGEAVAILNALIDSGYRQYTTNAVLFEAHALILTSMEIATAARFLREVAGGNTAVIRVRQSDEDRAKEIIFRFTDKDFS